MVIIGVILLISAVIFISYSQKSLLKIAKCESRGGVYKQGCYVEYALSTNNSATCKLLDVETKDICLFKFAIQEINDNLCYQINGTKFKDGCFNTLSVITKNELYCKEISSVQTRDSCYNMIAQAISNISFCNYIEGELKNICLSNVFFQIGDKTASCSILGTEVDRKECQRWKLGLMTNYQATEQISFDCGPLTGISKDNCILNLVKKTFEPASSICNSINSQEIKQECLKLSVN